ncbi:MAG: tRNA 2-thiouridine(34) synthase MnmA [Bacteroidales bacterium]|nr:tRNA 2-thiouridine(34) synthase MnmA [Bacteroidales bacterium]
MKKKVVIGLSGGIDSSMAALMLKNQGYEVIGLHFSFINEKYNLKLDEIASRLRISLVNIDLTNDFEIVKQHFASEYLKGRTPSPCTYCNRVIKWQKLIEFADRNNCEHISSGHYIRTIEKDGFYHLQKGIDIVKDQSYFMWELNSDTIKRMITPLGDYTKQQVREYAKENGFNDLAIKKESMGVCFLENTDYRDFLRKYIPDKMDKIAIGDVIDEQNQIIGSHEGYIHYTIGQKRGLTLKESRQAYVSKIDAKRNELVIGEKKSLNHFNIALNELHLINSTSFMVGSRVIANIRGLGLNPEDPAIVTSRNNNSLELKLSKPAWAVAPGQPVVLYENDIVLGGGIAKRSW